MSKIKTNQIITDSHVLIMIRVEEIDERTGDLSYPAHIPIGWSPENESDRRSYNQVLRQALFAFFDTFPNRKGHPIHIVDMDNDRHYSKSWYKALKKYNETEG